MDKISEFQVLASICSQIDALEQDERERVVRYLFHRYPIEKSVADHGQQHSPPPSMQESGVNSSEIRGVAVKSREGDLRMTIRDLKAKTAKDAARRLTYVTILANELLFGSRELSSRKVLVPVLREYRLYDGNTRRLIAEDKGIMRNGDSLTLDAHARAEAESFLHDIQDTSSKGTWQPGSQRRGNKLDRGLAREES
jgi:hypothetical protein